MNETEEFFDAVKRGDHDTVERMLRNDNQLAQSRDAEDATALHHAALKGHRRIVELLLKNGADINARENKNDTGTPAGWGRSPECGNATEPSARLRRSRRSPHHTTRIDRHRPNQRHDPRT